MAHAIPSLFLGVGLAAALSVSAVGSASSTALGRCSDGAFGAGGLTCTVEKSDVFAGLDELVSPAGALAAKGNDKEVEVEAALNHIFGKFVDIIPVATGIDRLTVGDFTVVPEGSGGGDKDNGKSDDRGRDNDKSDNRDRDNDKSDNRDRDNDKSDDRDRDNDKFNEFATFDWSYAGDTALVFLTVKAGSSFAIFDITGQTFGSATTEDLLVNSRGSARDVSHVGFWTVVAPPSGPGGPGGAGGPNPTVTTEPSVLALGAVGLAGMLWLMGRRHHPV